MHCATILTAVGVMGWMMACASDGATGEKESSAAQGGTTQTSTAQGGTPPAGPVLTDIDTQGEATETCTTLSQKLNLQNHQRMVTGRCAVEGLVASSNGTSSCAAVSQSCLADAPIALGPNRCAPKDFPACSSVTIAEFVACSVAIVDAGAAYYGYFTCASQLSTLHEEMQTPVECELPFARCQAFAEFW